MQENNKTLDRKRWAVLKKIAKVGPFLMASANEVKVQCGNPRCECAKNRKKRHEKLHLNWKEKGQKGKTLYVPVGLRQEVLEWIENYWCVKELMKEMNVLSKKMIKRYAKTKKKRIT